MKKGIIVLFALLVGFSFVTAPVFSAPPENKGKQEGKGRKDKSADMKKKSRKRHKGNGNRKGFDRDDWDGKNRWRHNRGYDRDDGRSVRGRGGISFYDARRIAIENRYTGYEQLPPGIRMNLARGKSLPPGIAKRAVPYHMLYRLPRHPGYQWYIVGSDLLLVDDNTFIIADIFVNVFE